MSRKVTTTSIAKKDKDLSGKQNKNAQVLRSPLAIAVWMVDNTALTFWQIAEFCQLHEMEVQAIANGTFANNILPVSPIGSYLTAAEIERCHKDENAKLQIVKFDSLIDLEIPKKKTKKYTPMLQRRSKADAILWLLTFAPELGNKQIIKLIGTTENTVESIRNKSHRNYAELTPKDPVIVGICAQRDIDNEIKIAKARLAVLEGK